MNKFWISQKRDHNSAKLKAIMTFLFAAIEMTKFKIEVKFLLIIF